jgi:hypothetical protein
MNYYGIQNSGYNSELRHWKYIKRVKKNGKWIYYYDRGELDKYNSKASETAEVITTYKNSNNLLSDEATMTTSDGKKYVVKSRGKIDQFIDKGKDWLSKTLYGYTTEDKYDKNETTRQKVTTNYGKTNDLLSGESSTVVGNSKKSSKKVNKTQGKIDRAVAKAEKWIYNKFFKNK